MTAIATDIDQAGRPDVEPADAALTTRLKATFRAEEHEAYRLAVWTRTLALAAIAVLLCFISPFPSVLYFHGLLLAFVLLGFLGLWLRGSSWHRDWHKYAFAVFDFAFLTFALIYPNPFSDLDEYPQFRQRYGNFIYFFVVLAALAFTYHPRLVVWGGAVGGLCWAVGIGWLLSKPETITTVPDGLTTQAIIERILQPTFVILEVHVQEIVVFAIVALVLSLVVLRSRRLVTRQVLLERERSNLARYFPPATVDRLAKRDVPLSQIREQHVCVLFADIVGFTSWAEGRDPRQVIGLLRGVHGRLEKAVFDHDGTVDKFIGDGMMATFGTPDPGPQDATNALACARAILESFDRWNRERAETGTDAVRISLGVHYGPVVVGDIGTDRRLELAVLGDTVNVASRLESLTRELECRAAVSDAVIQAAGQEAGGTPGTALAGCTRRGTTPLRGRQEPVTVWTLR